MNNVTCFENNVTDPLLKSITFDKKLNARLLPLPVQMNLTNNFKIKAK